MPKRIHIVGCTPRSGTTLMAELMVAGFDIDGFAEHELSIFTRPDAPYRVFCSKWPGETGVMLPLLYVDPDLWAVYLLRDPRDVIMSTHGQDGGRQYWSNLRMWRNGQRLARKAARHPRFLTVRYEDLVARPDEVQERLMRAMPFLSKRASFSEFHRVARPSGASLDALKGLRPISPASVGRWRKNKPRLVAQMALHGSIAGELIDLGYETDDAWLQELESVTPDNGETKWGETPPRWSERWGRWWYRRKQIVRYALSRTETGEAAVKALTQAKQALRGRARALRA